MMRALRETFDFPNLKSANWFPGHMAKAIRLISRKLQLCDCVLEVHDARIPFSGRNPKLNLMLRGRPKILVLNKEDLCDPHRKQYFMSEVSSRGDENILYSNLRSQHHHSIKELRSLILDVSGWNAKAGHGQDEDSVLHLMVLGMPNVGKSSLINALRRNYMKKGKGTGVSKIPGFTRAVSFKIKVAEKPDIFLLDTPGVMMPSIPTAEVALKLAVAGMLQDQVIGEELIADYLLFQLNRQFKFEYARYCDLAEPCDDIETVLEHVAKRIGGLQKGGICDYTRAAEHFLKRYRMGLLGRLTLDDSI